MNLGSKLTNDTGWKTADGFSNPTDLNHALTAFRQAVKGRVRRAKRQRFSRPAGRLLTWLLVLCLMLLPVEDDQRDSDTEDLWSTAEKGDEARDIDWDSMDGLDEEIVAYEEAERQRIEREAEYLEIGIKIEKIEKIEKSEAVIEENIGVGDETSTRHTNQSELDSTSRVDLAGFTANQERILHNNIPSGYPIKNRGVASYFGMRDDPIDKAKDFHGGIDLKAEINTAIFAPANGIISNVDYSALNGNWIVVSHKFEFKTYYLHLEKSQVRLGDMIHKGDLIGYSGESGRVTGPHLHYEIRYHDKKINPLPFLTWEFGTHEIFKQVKDIKWHDLIKLIND